MTRQPLGMPPVPPAPDSETDWAWRRQAHCAQGNNPNPFFDPWSIKDARRACAACPVTQQCLNAALDRHEQFGVWGGLLAGSPVWRQIAAARHTPEESR